MNRILIKFQRKSNRAQSILAYVFYSFVLINEKKKKKKINLVMF